VALLEAPALGPDLHHRHVRRVVDEQRGARHRARGAGDAVPVLVGHRAAAHVVKGDLGLRRQHPHGDLVATHLQGEHDRGEPVVHRGGPGDVEGEGGLTDRGPGRDDDELAWVQPVGQGVEVGEAGGHADERPVVGADGLDLVQGALQQVGQGAVVLGGATLGDTEHLRLSPVHDDVDVSLTAVPHLDDARAGLDEAAQDRPLADDLGVVAGVRRGRHTGDEGVDVRGPTDAGELSPLLQLGRQRHRVGRLAAPVQVEDRVVDGLVGGPVEVCSVQQLDDVGDGVLAQQHRPEHGLLGGDVLRRRAVERGTGRGGRQRGDAHCAPLPCSTDLVPVSVLPGSDTTGVSEPGD
jgi:hypothetical protein